MNRQHMTNFVAAAALMLISGCTPSAGLEGVYAVDAQPPVLIRAAAEGEKQLAVRFSEPVEAEIGEFAITPEVRIDAVETDRESLTITTGDRLEAGAAYLLSGRVSDLSGNQTFFSLETYGWNPDPPEIVINEFTARGSKAHPDTIELLVRSDGNTAGVTVYDGTAQQWRQHCILPSREVAAGDYLVIHCREEREEETPLEGSSQFRMNEPIGLSGNNGVLTVYSSPTGEIIDAVVYSNRFSDSDTRYGGFAASHTWEGVQLLWESGHWRAPEGERVPEQPIPEQAVRSEDMTATRTLCRSFPPEDTDSAEDWHTVPTSGSTFGYENTNETYQEP